MRFRPLDHPGLRSGVQFPTVKNLLSDAPLEIELDSLYPQLGYPAGADVAPPVSEVCREQLARLSAFAEPWGSWREIQIEGVGNGVVRLEGGGELHSARLASLFARATALRLVIVTLGPRFAPEVERLMEESSAMDAMVFDAAGTVVATGLIHRLVEGICREALEHGRGTTIRYGPGYTGWGIRDIEVLFSYLEADEPPVRLTEQLMMIPVKSLLNVVGITPHGKRSAETLPCRICDLRHCSARREPYRGGS